MQALYASWCPRCKGRITETAWIDWAKSATATHLACGPAVPLPPGKRVPSSEARADMSPAAKRAARDWARDDT